MDIDNVKTIVDTAREGDDATKKITTIVGVPCAVSPSGAVTPLKNVLEIAQSLATAPLRRKGTSTHTELASFIAHINRFKDGDSAVFADIDGVKLTAVLDYHKTGPIEMNGQRWGEHRSVYACPLSEQWKRWTEHDGDQMSQDAFAQFIEDHMDDLASPSGNGEDKDLPMPSDVLTMARNLVINSRGAFSRSINPTTGESSLVCKDEHDVSTSTKIPRAFLLGIPVFAAGRGYRVEARMRMNVGGGRAMFSYVLYRREEILRDAFDEVRTIVADKTALPLFAGSPE